MKRLYLQIVSAWFEFRLFQRAIQTESAMRRATEAEDERTRAIGWLTAKETT